MELRAGGFEDEEACEAASNCDVIACCGRIDDALLFAITYEGVGMWFASYVHAGPFVYGDPHMGGGDVWVLFEEVGGHDGGEKFGRVDWMLFGEHIDGVLLGIGRYDVGVIGVRPGPGDVALKHGADGHFGDGLCAIGMAVGLEEADIVFAVLCV